jgi:hypothetical protein
MKKALGWIILAICGAALSFGAVQRGGQPGGSPDLVISNIDFQKVQSGTDSDGKTYWIFNVIVKVKNQGNASAGAFKVRLERNNGPGGAYQTACQTCVIDVPGLGAGQETGLQPRQFNNANGAPSKFKALADSAGQIGESNEGNNSREESFFQMTVPEGGGGLSPIAKPDLTVVSFEFRDVTSAVVGGKAVITFKIAATVKNLGPGSSPTALLFYEGSADQKVGWGIRQKDVPALGVGDQVELICDSITYEVGTPTKYYRMEVDPYHAIAETNENNNATGYKTIPGVK